MLAHMHPLLGRVWWIGGAPCSGKSTLAAALAARLGARLYVCDEEFERHAADVSVERGPTLKKVTSISVDDRLAQPLGIQVADVFRLYREAWPQLLEDLSGMEGTIVAEGAALLPELLLESGVPPDRAVWIVPTESFQRAHYARRGWAQELVELTSDPVAAFESWMQRDAQFATLITTQAGEAGYSVLVTKDETPITVQQAELDAILGTI